MKTNDMRKHFSINNFIYEHFKSFDLFTVLLLLYLRTNRTFFFIQFYFKCEINIFRMKSEETYNYSIWSNGYLKYNRKMIWLNKPGDTEDRYYLQMFLRFSLFASFSSSNSNESYFRTSSKVNIQSTIRNVNYTQKYRRKNK